MGRSVSPLVGVREDLMRRAGVVAVLVVAVVVGSLGPASALRVHARIEGATSVTNVIVDEMNTGQPVGTVTTRTWTFTPDCSTGACITTLERVRNTSPRVTTYRLKLRRLASGEPVYRATIRGLTDCFDSETGSLLVADGMDTLERIEVRTPRRTTQNVATKIKGQAHVEFNPTNAAAAAGCESGWADITFTGVFPTN